MLIEFKVANFRSIREEQTFTLVANNADKSLQGCVISQELPGLTGIRLLRGAAIYGANASGKSNLLSALAFLAGFIRHSATKLQPGDTTGVEPFKLDGESHKNPSRFEITFVVEQVRYIFGLVVTPKRVLQEYLVAYPKGSPQRWYSREYDEGKEDYKWARPSLGFKHDKTLQEKTRENSLFLSVGPQFNHPQLTPVFNWFKTSLRFMLLSQDPYLQLSEDFTASMLMEPAYHERILNMLRSADIGVVEGKAEEQEISPEEFKKHLPPALFAKMEKQDQLKGNKTFSINLAHKSENKEPVFLDYFNEESVGTKKFFSLIGPWIDLLENGYTVIIDEIETSLHPILVKELIRLAYCSVNNPVGAQVIFATHNPILLDGELMRRDQIWFTEKSPAGSTHLYPLTDYQPRKDEALARGYLAGRYGAIPYLPEGLKL